ELVVKIALGHAAAALDQPVGEGRLAVIDVGDDREVPDVGEVGHVPVRPQPALFSTPRRRGKALCRGERECSNRRTQGRISSESRGKTFDIRQTRKLPPVALTTAATIFLPIASISSSVKVRSTG